MKDLCLPSTYPFLKRSCRTDGSIVQTFTAVQHLILLTKISLLFGPQSSRSNYCDHPEVRLIALLVITVKLYNSFDELERFARSSNDTGSLAIDWSVWEIARQRYKAQIREGRPFVPGDESKVVEHDVFGLSDQQLDAYLDWYNNVWVDEEPVLDPERRVQSELLEMFPTGRNTLHPKPLVLTADEETQLLDNASHERLDGVQEGLKSLPIIDDDESSQTEGRTLRVGGAYPIYEDEDGLQGIARVFYAEVAETAGLSLADLIDAVYLVEQRFTKRKYEMMEDYDGIEGDRIGKLDHRTSRGKEKARQSIY